MRKSTRKTRKMTRQTQHRAKNSDSSYDSGYRQKLRKRKSDQKKDPIKLCTHLIEKLLTTAYKSKIIRLKMDEDLLQRRIYSLTFVESLEMIFSHYK